MSTQIKIGGFGGQGVILSAYVFGTAAAIYDNKHATMTQIFGPEARGSACSAQVIISPDLISYPYVSEPDILVVMSDEAFRKFYPEMNKKNGILIYEQDKVNPEGIHEGVKAYSVPATRFAEELGKKLILNIVMVGFFTAITELVTPEAMRKAIMDNVPEGTEDLNLKAFERGYEYFAS